MVKGKRKSGENKKRKSLAVQQNQHPQEIQSEPENDDEEMCIYSDEEGGTRVGDIYIPPPVKPYCAVEIKGPRLIITKIENFDFKSYAGRVVLGPFHHCFTAIIGPNGSGKSNVIDSMLFVFGYRAQKIRCKKLSVLLHKSALFPETRMCKVAIYFKQILETPDGCIEDIPNSEIVIARTAYINNTSEYTLNNKKVQFKDISKLLKHHGIDLDRNRFLILQGEVESIAMMKAKASNENECGMLEYLEEIIGTNRYKQPLNKINGLVETLSEERAQNHNRCKLSEREMKDLEQPYNEAIEYMKFENSCTETFNVVLQKTISEVNKNIKDLNVEKEGVQNELKEHDDETNELAKQIIEKENEIKEKSKKYTELCNIKEEMEKNQARASKNYIETQNIMVATNKRRKQNQDQLQKLESKLEEIKGVPKKNEIEIAECEKKVSVLTKESVSLENKLEENYSVIEQQTRPFVEERERLETDLMGKRDIFEKAKSEVVLSETELQILQYDEIAQRRKYETLKLSIEESKQNLIEKHKEMKEIKTLIPKYKHDINQKKIEYENCKKELQTLEKTVSELRIDIAEKKSSLQTAKSNNLVLTSLMKQKHEGNIPGIIGRLGDLGGIDAKYDVAVSTACGRLDNILVDCVDTAQECIEYLRRNDIGRGTFIALDKIQRFKEYCKTKIKTPENVLRLFDLIRVEDDRILPAFYFALRNTLIANDLDQATRIAYGSVRQRVVTLNGELIEISGTMSGGGKTKIRGKMGLKASTKTRLSSTPQFNEKKLEQLERKAEEMQSRVNYLYEMEGKYENEIRDLKSKLYDSEREERKLQVIIRSLEEQLPSLEKELKEQKERAETTRADPKKVKELEEQIQIKKNISKDAEIISNEISEKVKEVNKKIANLHGTKIKSIKEKIESTAKQIKALNSNIVKLKVEITSSERNLTRTEVQIQDLKDEIKKSEDNLIELKEKRTQNENESNELLKKINEIKIEIEEAGKDASHIKKEVTKIKEKENEMKLRRIEVEEKLRVVNKKISTIAHRLGSLNEKLKSLKINNIPGTQKNISLELKTFTEEELETYSLSELETQYNSMMEKLKDKQPNLSVIQDYLSKREAYLERVKSLEDITNKRNEMRQLYDDVRKKRHKEFMQGFHIITRKLKEMYQMITQGGDAELELVDSMDPFTEGVSFSVRPPKKTWKNISNLSGGEKTLSSLALVFALHYYKPSPLYFMDEIDAALDFKNISIVAHYIKERTKNAQFIIISLRSNMFELADYIVGIYKIQDCTKSCSIENYIFDESTILSMQTNLANTSSAPTSQTVPEEKSLSPTNNDNSSSKSLIENSEDKDDEQNLNLNTNGNGDDSEQSLMIASTSNSN